MNPAPARRARPPVNPRMLRWARKRSGKSIEDAAKKAGATPDRISEWEADDARLRPTVRQARLLAQFYGRHFMEFFRPTPPEIPEPKLVPDFRVYRGADDEQDTLVLKQIQAWAEAVRLNAIDLFEELGEECPKIPDEIFTNVDSDASTAAKLARRAIGFEFSEQISISDSERHKLPETIRRKFEKIGVLVIKNTNLRKIDARGLCIVSFPLPVIVFGNEAPTAQAFTLAHEFAHVLVKQSGVIGGIPRSITEPRWKTERWCNDFAASFLMPSDYLAEIAGPKPGTPKSEIGDEDLHVIAKRFGVSPHAALIRLTQAGYVRESYYWDVKKEVFEQEEKNYRAFGRPAYYGRRYESALGNLYTGLVIEAWTTGRITNHNAAEYMGIKNFAHLYDIKDNFGRS